MSVICIICSDSVIPGSDIFATPCGHLFHYPCLIQWIERSKTCPQCRCKTTEKTIVKIFFNHSNTDHIVDDVGTLQNKIDNLQFQQTLKDKDIKNLNEKYKKAKGQNAALRQEVSTLENKIRSHESVVHALKDQISYFKSKAKDQERLIDEINKLKTKLKDVELVQTAIEGTREEVNEILRNENNPESLVILVATLKKALIDVENKKLSIDHKYKQVQSEVIKYRRDINTLELSNCELRKALESVKTSSKQEKENLKKIISKLTEGKIEKTTPLKRILVESPAPIMQKRSKPDDSVIVLDDSVGSSPLVEEKTVNILNTSSPYLPIKTSAVNVNSESVLKHQQTSSNTNHLSIFKTSSKQTEGLRSCKSDETVYTGLGGQSKVSFATNKGVKGTTVGLGRYKLKPGSSKKITKLNSIGSFTKK